MNTTETDEELLLRIFGYNNIPEHVTQAFLDAEIFLMLKDFIYTSEELLLSARETYVQHRVDLGETREIAQHRWSVAIDTRILYVQKWFKTFARLYGSLPNPRGLTEKHFDVLPC